MPDWEETVRRRLAPLHLEATAESSLAEEMAQHVEDKYRELCQGGLSAAEAQRRVLEELDDMVSVRARISKESLNVHR
jgi:putative ABC transport system permease protein